MKCFDYLNDALIIKLDLLELIEKSNPQNFPKKFS